VPQLVRTPTRLRTAVSDVRGGREKTILMAVIKPDGDTQRTCVRPAFFAYSGDKVSCHAKNAVCTRRKWRHARGSHVD